MRHTVCTVCSHNAIGRAGDDCALCGARGSMQPPPESERRAQLLHDAALCGARIAIHEPPRLAA